jgi:hypothetical protein
MNHTITMKRWQAFVLLGFSGFAIGNMLAKLTNAMGF